MKTINVGIIGVGGIGVNSHLKGYLKAQGVRVAAICDIDEKRLQEVGEEYGIPEAMRFKDYHDLVACDGVDAVDICTPNDSHCAIGMAAVAAGKPFNVEKPLGISVGETEALCAAAEAKGVKSQLCLSYRFLPAVRFARKLVDDGVVGRVHSIYATYLKDSAFWPGRRLDWRFDAAIARYGVSGDLAVHILDTVRFLTGDCAGLIAQNDIIIPERKKLDSEEIVPVTTDDVCNFFAKMKNGATALFGISRAAFGNRNHIRLEVYGDRGGLRFDLNDVTHIEIGTEARSDMRFEEVPEQYRSNQQQSFIDLLNGVEDPFRPTLRDGVALQRVLEALIRSSEQQRWVEVE